MCIEICVSTETEIVIAYQEVEKLGHRNKHTCAVFWHNDKKQELNERCLYKTRNIFHGNLLYSSCHFFDFVFKACFDSVMGVASELQVILFKRIIETWSNTDKKKYCSGNENVRENVRVSMLKFLEKAIT